MTEIRLAAIEHWMCCDDWPSAALRDTVRDLITEIRLGRAALVGAEADRERLDWLDTNSGAVTHATGYHGGSDAWMYGSPTHGFIEAASLRAAIDSARAAA